MIFWGWVCLRCCECMHEFLANFIHVWSVDHEFKLIQKCLWYICVDIEFVMQKKLLKCSYCSNICLLIQKYQSNNLTASSICTKIRKKAFDIFVLISIFWCRTKTVKQLVLSIHKLIFLIQRYQSCLPAFSAPQNRY